MWGTKAVVEYLLYASTCRVALRFHQWACRGGCAPCEPDSEPDSDADADSERDCDSDSDSEFDSYSCREGSAFAECLPACSMTRPRNLAAGASQR
eukprot:307724-Chlamydomonas_euryale.AAC.1